MFINVYLCYVCIETFTGGQRKVCFGNLENDDITYLRSLPSLIISAVAGAQFSLMMILPSYICNRNCNMNCIHAWTDAFISIPYHSFSFFAYLNWRVIHNYTAPLSFTGLSQLLLAFHFTGDTHEKKNRAHSFFPGLTSYSCVLWDRESDVLHCHREMAID